MSQSEAEGERGPQKGLQWSDAISSVVQLFTRRCDAPLAARFGFAGGEFETLEESAGISGGTERYGRPIDVGPTDTDGILESNTRHHRLAFLIEAPSRHSTSQPRSFQPLALRDSYPKRRRSLPAARPEPVAGDRLIYPWWRHALAETRIKLLGPKDPTPQDHAVMV